MDPLTEMTGTPYQYCYQNPVIYTDPTGMMPNDGGGDGGFWRSVGNLFKSKARVHAEDKARDLKNDSSVKEGTVSTYNSSQSFRKWSVTYEDLDDEGAAHRIDYSNDGYLYSFSFGGKSTEQGSTGEGNPSAGSISTPSQGTYFDRWDHQVAKGVGQGGGEMLLSYGIGRAIGFFKARSLILGSDAATLANASRMVSEKGTFQVLLHGNADRFIVDGVSMTSKELAKHMLSSGYTKGTPVRLISCTTGVFPDGAAYQLSRYLRAPVTAPTTPIKILGDGSYMMMNSGRFRTFYNTTILP